MSHPEGLGRTRTGHGKLWNRIARMPGETGPENFPSNDGKNPSFGRIFPSKPGFFPSQTNVQSLWVCDCDRVGGRILVTIHNIPHYEYGSSPRNECRDDVVSRHRKWFLVYVVLNFFFRVSC